MGKQEKRLKQLMILGKGTTWRIGERLVRKARADGVPMDCWGVNDLWLHTDVVDVAFNMHLTNDVPMEVLRRYHPTVSGAELVEIRDGLPNAHFDPAKPLECWKQRMFMCEVPAGAPMTVERYPIEDVMTKYPMGYFNNGISYMIAYALLRGDYSKIHFYGTDYHTPPDGSLRIEAEYERPCQEFWMGIAMGQGVGIEFPTASNIFAFADGGVRVMYGYQQTHKHKYERAFEYKQMPAGGGAD